jgi:hypothetical protein
MCVDMPGQMGRLRAARVVSGYPVECPDDETVARLERYTLEHGWSLKPTVDFIDAMLDGGLLTRTGGPRPTLVPTRAGFRALEALESTEDASSVLTTIPGCS